MDVIFGSALNGPVGDCPVRIWPAGVADAHTASADDPLSPFKGRFALSKPPLSAGDRRTLLFKECFHYEDSKPDNLSQVLTKEQR